MGLGRDQRRHHVQRPQERLPLQRRQPGRPPERVSVELLVDLDGAVRGGAVDRVAATAEVDQVEQVEMLLELGCGEPEALPEVGGRDARRRFVAAARGEKGEQRLEEREALRRDRAGRPVGDLLGGGPIGLGDHFDPRSAGRNGRG